MAVEVWWVITRVGHRSVHVHVIMYTTQGHCVGGELLYICMNAGSSPLVCGMLWPKHNRPCIVPAKISVLMNRNKRSIL